MRRGVAVATDAPLVEPGRTALTLFEDAITWPSRTSDPALLQAGARRFVLALGRIMQFALLTEHAQWALDTEGDESFTALARRLARTPAAPVGAAPRAETALIL